MFNKWISNLLDKASKTEKQARPCPEKIIQLVTVSLFNKFSQNNYINYLKQI